MWQTIVTVILLIGAAVYVARHFLKIYRTGNDSVCSGCSSSGSCGAKHDVNRICTEEHLLSPRTGEEAHSQDLRN